MFRSKNSGVKQEHPDKQVRMEHAHTLFLLACERLKNINNWNKYCAVAMADTLLTDKNGVPARGEPQVGDYIRIDIPGPGTESGDGYDWVQIEEIAGRNSRPYR